MPLVLHIIIGNIVHGGGGGGGGQISGDAKFTVTVSVTRMRNAQSLVISG